MASETARLTEDPEVWFREHFDGAAGQILSFLGEDGISIEGKAVADVGCGDGIIDLGLAVKGKPAKLVGYDLKRADVDALRRTAIAASVCDELPDCLAFVVSEPDVLPSENDQFDVVTTWSVFEHVSRPVEMFAEVKRVLKPDGVMFLQLWPFFPSEHGGHLWPQYDEPFPHLLHNDSDIREQVRGKRGTDPDRDAVDEYDSLNRITLDQLQSALLAAGLIVTKLELLTDSVHVPRELAHLPLSLIGTSGVKLIAVPR
jgi:SAM-dependent methyltransferase